ncbi:hypothetical protein ARMGADRAFT_1020378 [Armillaria gallica]|uniref:Uncharacterized protein n=1 Tax=Armillaria gallica TaxID=47427 RepID=A0A2H3CZ52_ARMGA|nr:hypothetical protein ARMGADRAFT_1020378 [Armillaria gallica]
MTQTEVTDPGRSPQRARIPSCMKPPKVSQPNAHTPSNGDEKISRQSAHKFLSRLRFVLSSGAHK